MTQARSPARLDTVAPDVADALRLADGGIARRVAAAVAERAIRDTGVVDDRVSAAVRALRRGEPDEDVHRRMLALTDELDEKAYALDDAVAEGRALRSEHEAAFSRARAVAAVAAALEPDPVIAALDAAYEAQAAVDDMEKIRRVIAPHLEDT